MKKSTDYNDFDLSTRQKKLCVMGCKMNENELKVIGCKRSLQFLLQKFVKLVLFQSTLDVGHLSLRKVSKLTQIFVSS